MARYSLVVVYEQPHAVLRGFGVTSRLVPNHRAQRDGMMEGAA
jgi:hypothetical protein